MQFQNVRIKNLMPFPKGANFSNKGFDVDLRLGSENQKKGENN